jgi:transcriptional regulator with XRE-family HTH domain
MDIDVHLGRRIRNRRVLLKWTEQQLADASGMDCEQIQDYERGDREMPASGLWSLAQALSVPVTYFFDGFEDRVDQEAGLEHSD